MPSPPPAPPPAAEGITRRNHGLNHSYRIDGLKVPGVTTITGHFKSGALAKYPGTATANYAVDNWERLAELPPAARLKDLYGGQYAERDAAAGRGTQVHAIAHRLHEGETEVAYPEELAGHVEACVDFLDRLEPKIVAAELILGNRTVRYCGTLDLIADLGPVPWDGTIIPPARWLLDLKTGRKGIFPEHVLQLGAYEHAEVFLAEDGAERPMEWLEIERCAAVWIRGDGWDLIPVDTGPGTWAYFQYLAWLYHQEEARTEWVGVAAGPWPALRGD
jgi:hypothetical protein